MGISTDAFEMASNASQPHVCPSFTRTLLTWLAFLVYGVHVSLDADDYVPWLDRQLVTNGITLMT